MVGYGHPYGLCIACISFFMMNFKVHMQVPVINDMMTKYSKECKSVQKYAEYAKVLKIYKKGA